MKILGIAHDIVISSSAVLIDGDIVAACPEERFKRIKQDEKSIRKGFEACKIWAENQKDWKSQPAHRQND